MFRKRGKHTAEKPNCESPGQKKSRNEAEQERCKKNVEASLVSPPALSKASPRKRLTKTEAEAPDKIHITEEQFHICFLICFQERFNEPLKEDWNECVCTIQHKVGGHCDTILRVFKEASKRNAECVLGSQKPTTKDWEGLLRRSTHEFLQHSQHKFAML